MSSSKVSKTASCTSAEALLSILLEFADVDIVLFSPGSGSSLDFDSWFVVEKITEFSGALVKA